MSNLYIGIDPGFTETGIVVLRSDGFTDKYKITSAANQSDSQRFDDYYCQMKNLIDCFVDAPTDENVMVGIEIPMGRHAGNAAKIGQAYALAVLGATHSTGSDLRFYRPGHIKKFVTGKGNSKKDVMIKDVFKRWGFETDNHNLADAYAIAQLVKSEVEHETNN